MAFTVTGGAGALHWGYHPAASVRAWTVTRDADGWALSATLSTSDTFRLSQRPLVFEASHVHGAWRWPIRELQITGATLTARLGPQEVPHVLTDATA